MTLTSRFSRFLVAAACAFAALAAAVSPAFADKLHLKDGRVLDGRVVKEGDGYVYFAVKAGKLESEQFFTSDQIAKIEKTDAAAATDAVAAAPAKEPTTSADGRGRATRVAILNFGAPSSYQGKYEDMVGTAISAKAFEDVIPMLEKDKVDVVVVRVNSGGGMLLELAKFHKVFQEKYKPKFRTVAWIESAISAAAMSPWVIEEMYMLPEGNIGGCTGWSGDMIAMKGIGLEEVLYMMEKASALGNRSPYIMRAMQILDAPLSCNIDEVTGEVTWFQDSTTGKFVVNTADKILTLSANDAVKYKFARGIAKDRDELAKAMGLQEVEWAGKQASDYIDNFMKDATKFSRELGLIFEKYGMSVAAAAALQGDENKTKRGAEIGRARSHLREIRRLFGINPNFGLMYGIDDEWFDQQERVLRELASR